MSSERPSASVLEALFLRRGQPTASTRVFREFEASVRDRVSAEAQLVAGEEPIVLSVSSDGWTLITNKRTVSLDRARTKTVDHQHLIEVEPDMSEIRLGTVKNLSHVSRLRLVIAGGQEMIAIVEAGEPLNGFLNILKRVVTRPSAA